jgi:hypothetical protein
LAARSPVPTILCAKALELHDPSTTPPVLYCLELKEKEELSPSEVEMASDDLPILPK